MIKNLIDKKIPLWLGILTQTIVIVTFIVGVLWYPVKQNFNMVYGKIAIIERDYEKHCEEQEKRLNDFALLGETNIKLGQICNDLERLFDTFEKYQEENAKFRDTFYTFMSTFPKK